MWHGSSNGGWDSTLSCEMLEIKMYVKTMRRPWHWELWLCAFLVYLALPWHSYWLRNLTSYIWVSLSLNKISENEILKGPSDSDILWTSRRTYHKYLVCACTNNQWGMHCTWNKEKGGALQHRTSPNAEPGPVCSHCDPGRMAKEFQCATCHSGISSLRTEF